MAITGSQHNRKTGVIDAIDFSLIVPLKKEVKYG